MLKKFIFVTIFSILLVLPGAARAEKIRSFDAVAKIQEDASVQISEKIQYDFEDEYRHGIYRNIPYKYPGKIGNYNLQLTGFSVTDEVGKRLSFNAYKDGLDIVVKIGDENQTLTGLHTYIINYTVKQAINYFETDDEFYWNMTGNAWPVTIESASAIVFFPETTDLDKITLSCYSGEFGSNKNCEQIKTGNPIMATDRNLLPGSGLTMAVSFPKGIIHEPTATEKRIRFILANSILILPILVFFGMFWLWKRYGKDPSGQGVVVAQFDAPDNLTPAEVGLLVDERADNKDISSEIIYLATRGYLKINRLEKEGFLSKKTDYEFERLKSTADLQNEHEKTVMVSLFGAGTETPTPQKVLLSSLQNNPGSYEEIKKVGRLISRGLVAKGYFRSVPSTVRAFYFFAGLTFMTIGFFTIGLFLSPLLAAISYFVSGLIIMIFSRWMPARTNTGVFARDHILGLKNYLQVAEADRIQFHNAPDKNPAIFEKLLPYAMVLGVEKDWAKQFESIYTSPPSWYHDAAGNQFSAMMLVNNFGDFRSSLYHTLASNASQAAAYANRSAAGGGHGSSGGGFSGGGFGGGGGRSW